MRKERKGGKKGKKGGKTRENRGGGDEKNTDSINCHTRAGLFAVVFEWLMGGKGGPIQSIIGPASALYGPWWL